MRIKASTAPIIIIGFIAAVAFRFLAIAAIDAPHNASNNISCGSCHGVALLNSPFWGGSYSPVNIDDTVYNKLCLNCHRTSSGPYTDTNAPLVKTHSSLNTSNKYGDWTRECRTCHDPHYQKQKNYKNTDAGNLYLATGTITACVYNGDGTSTLTYSTITYKSGWGSVKLTEKTGAFRRTILFPNVGKLGYNYPVIAVDTIAKTITVTGNATAYLYPPTTFAAMSGQYSKDSIDIKADPSVSPPPASIYKTVKFFDQVGAKSFADGDTTYNGACEVCHTQTTHFRNDGSGSDQNHTNVGSGIPGTNCISCHPHVDGFKPSCNACHGYPPPPLASIPLPTGSTTAGAHVLHVTTKGYQCSICHYNSTGEGVTHNNHIITLGFFSLLGAYTGGSYDGQTTANYQSSDPGTTVSKTGLRKCSNLYCHGGTMAPDGGTASAIWDTPSSAACGTCHGATTGAPPTRGSHSKHAGSAAGGKQLDCTVCHSGYTSAHLNGSVNWAYDTAIYTWLSGALYRGAASGSASPVPSASYGTCINLYCHSQGISNTSPYPASIIPASWGGVLDATCTGCHGGDKNAVNKMGTGSHTKHVIDSSLDCTKCHNQTASNSRTIINQANHVNNLVNVAYDGASNPGGNATYNGSTSPMTKTPGTAYGSCSNIYCHGSGTPTWGSSIAIACDGCHKASNILQGKHGTHYGTAAVATSRTAANNSSSTTYIFNCGACHDPGATTHGGGAVSGIRAAQVAFDATYAGGGTYTAGGTLAGTDNGFKWTAGATNNACSNTYCHSQGTSLTTPYAAPNITSFQWTSSTLTCSGCHGNPPAYANGSPKANSHSAHSAYTCNTCHVNTTSGGTIITNKAKHVNKAYNVDAGAGASFTYTYNVAGGTCSNISCHCNASIPAQWGATSACLNCHSGSCGNRAAITPQFSSNSHHVQGVSLTSAHCYQCHWEANSNGTINHTYHGGSGAPGSVVDIVIYGIGTRPTTYTAGTTAIQYTANGTRAEIRKLNSHCLGCHNTQSTTQTTDTDFRAGSFSQATLNGITGPGASVQLAIQISAGTGAEGAYSCSGTCTIASGTHNYTTFSVSPGATVNFSGTNPVIINATIGVTINGTINLNGGNGGAGSSGNIGSSGAAGAGGSIGGSNNTNGSGLGGGGAGLQFGGGGGGAGYGGAGGNGGRSSWSLSGGAGGSAYSTVNAGGSGGGSGRSDISSGYYGGGGGGGGGSLKIVSASQIAVSGPIAANGGSGGSGYGIYAGGGGGGSGGGITLIGSTITNGISISASGNTGGNGGTNGGGGGGGAGGRISIQTVNGTISGNAPIANGGAGGNGAIGCSPPCIGSPGASSAPTYSTVPYNSSGTFVSGPVDAGINPDAWTSVTWHTTQTATTQIILKAKSYSSQQTPNFAGCNTLATITSANANSSASLSGYSCVNSTDRYIYYQATLSGDTTGTPSLDDVTMNYESASQQTSPFGDGKRPNQYAWDGRSIGERYSQTGTTGWGKYSGGNTTPKDTQTKAYSAHGNAVNNRGGWDLNETWTNTRTGSENIACFDCHNSHGSSASGTTTSYTSVTTNGGILKDTEAGKGGYSITYKPQAGGSTANKNAYNAGTGLCFDCHVNAASGTTPWGYQSTFGATQAIMGYWDTAYFGPGTGHPQQRFGYKSSNAQKGGHFGASSALSGTPTGTVNGLCTPCHDPHGVSPTLGSNMQYGVPLLKGTWVTSLYKEDRAPANDVIGTIRTDKGREGIHYQIDQNTLGSDITSSVSGITQTDTQFAGLCLNCHSKSSLTNGTNHTWKSKDRVHESVKGWKTADATIQHNYPCSKCHTPHNSGLPRLMITNCLDSRHKGFRANNTAAITSGTGSEVQCGPDTCYGTNDLFLGTPRLFWPGCTSQCTGVGSGRKPGNWSAEQFWAGWPGSVFHGWYHTVTCHENYDSNQYWNTKTPWVFSGLIGLRWNVSVSKEELGVIDTTTGNFTVKGTVGDLVSWSGSSVISGNTLYVSGVNSSDQPKLYILNTTTGSLTSSVNLSADGLFLSGFDSSGNLIGIRWNVSTSKEEFGVINTTTGSFTVKGTVGDLVSWSGSSVISGNTLYVIGVNSADQNKLYILNTTTGSLTSSVNLSDYLFLAGFDSGGNLIGLRWNVSTSKYEFGVINTTTGNFAVKGTVGDLDGLAPPAIISGNTLYVNGQNSGGQNKLYILNTTTGSLTSAVNLSADGLFLSGSI